MDHIRPVISDVVPTIANPPRSEAQGRLVARFVAEVQLAAVVNLVAAIEAFSGKPIVVDRAIVMAVVLRGAPEFRCGSTGLACSGGDRDHAISINAIAASLGRPFETVRRHVNGLIDSGLCVRTPRGIIVAPGLADAPVMQQMIRDLHDLMVRLIDYATRHGVHVPIKRSDLPYQPSATIAATLDLVLASVEYLEPHYGDWLEMAVVNATIAANARPVTFDPVLAIRYAATDAVPPRHLRRAVSVTGLARALRMPYSTVQRQVKASILRGQLERVPGGIMITQEQLDADGVRVAGPAAVSRALRAFGRLVPGGFPFDDPPSCYMTGPPALLDFGDGVPV